MVGSASRNNFSILLKITEQVSDSLYYVECAGFICTSGKNGAGVQVQYAPLKCFSVCQVFNGS